MRALAPFREEGRGRPTGLHRRLRPLRALHLGEPFTISRIGYTVRYASTAPGYALWWQSRRERFHPEFVRFVDDNLGKPIEAVNANSREAV